MVEKADLYTPVYPCIKNPLKRTLYYSFFPLSKRLCNDVELTETPVKETKYKREEDQKDITKAARVTNAPFRLAEGRS